MPRGNDTAFGHQEGFSIPEGVNDPSVETFPIPKVSDTEELPPYVAHPDDFASTRGTGGYGPYADGTIPNILSTPVIDFDPQDNIFMNEGGSDKWSRAPKSLQDEMALEAAKRGEGIHLENLELGDPRYKGMHKMRLTVKSDAGKDSVIHYVFNPETGETMDFKFKKHSTD